MHNTDTPQAAYLRRLAEKRNRAFEAETEFEREIVAAYRKTTGMEYSRAPIVPSNRAIETSSAIEEPVAWYDRVDWPDVLGTICGVLIVVAIAAACCWAAARAMGMTR